MLKLPDFSELQFDEQRHIYTLRGQQLPSVTTLLKPLSNQVYKNIDETVLARAAARGTAVHNAIKNYDKIGIVDEALVPVSIAGINIRPVDRAAVMRLIRSSKGTVQIPRVNYRETVRMSFKK